MSRQTIGVILMIGIIAGVAWECLYHVGSFDKKEVVYNTTSVTSSSDTLSCGHKSFWLRTDKNGNTYCQSCSIDERLRMTLPKF